MLVGQLVFSTIFPKEPQRLSHKKKASVKQNKIFPIEDKKSDVIYKEIDISEIMEEVLAEIIESLTIYSNIASKVAKKTPEERDELSIRIIEESK